MSRGLLSLEWRRLKGYIIIVCTFIKGNRAGGSADLLSLVTSDSTRGHGVKLSWGKFRLSVRKRLTHHSGSDMLCESQTS